MFDLDQKPVVSITVTAPTGAGKSTIIAIIDKAFKDLAAEDEKFKFDVVIDDVDYLYNKRMLDVRLEPKAIALVASKVQIQINEQQAMRNHMQMFKAREAKANLAKYQMFKPGDKEVKIRFLDTEHTKPAYVTRMEQAVAPDCIMCKEEVKKQPEDIVTQLRTGKFDDVYMEAHTKAVNDMNGIRERVRILQEQTDRNSAGKNFKYEMNTLFGPLIKNKMSAASASDQKNYLEKIKQVIEANKKMSNGISISGGLGSGSAGQGLVSTGGINGGSIWTVSAGVNVGVSSSPGINAGIGGASITGGVTIRKEEVDTPERAYERAMKVL